MLLKEFARNSNKVSIRRMDLLIHAPLFKGNYNSISCDLADCFQCFCNYRNRLFYSFSQFCYESVPPDTLYCRISLDDGGDNESMSISNQKLMLRDFAEKHGMFQYEYYVYDGYTGRNFNRPSFQRMIADIEAGEIGCVITDGVDSLTRQEMDI